MIAQAHDRARDVSAAAEEAIGVLLLERGETGVRALVVAQLAAVAAGDQRFDIGEQRLRVGIALELSLLQTAIDDALEALRQILDDAAERRDRRVELGRRADQRRDRIPRERVLSGGQLETEHARRPE